MITAQQLRQSLRRGAQVIIVVQVLSQLVTLIVLSILLRLLGPGPYGLLAMVNSLFFFLRLVIPGGLDVAAIQEQELSDRQISGLFWMNQCLGLLMAAVAVVAAPLLMLLYSQPQVMPLTLALAGTLLAMAWGTQHQALLQRDMRLSTLAVIKLAAQVLGGAAAITAAVAGAGVWSLVVQQYGEWLTLAALSWWTVPWRPQWVFLQTGVRRLLHIGGYFTLSQVACNFVVTADKVLIGCLLGPVALGLYNQAFNLMMKVVQVLLLPLCGIMLPTLSRAVADRPHYRTLLLGFFRTIGMAMFPCTVGLAIVGPEAMLVLGGEKWKDAGPLLTVLALAVFAQAFFTSFGGIFASVGRTRRLFAASVVIALIMGGAFGLGYGAGKAWGNPTLGVAAGFSVGMVLLVFPAYLLLCLKTVDVSLRDWLAPMVRPASAALAMGAAVLAGKWALQRLVPGISAPWLLASELAVGVAVYAVLARRELRWFVQLRREATLFVETASPQR